jgi:uncharacterized OsmC-like protein
MAGRGLRDYLSQKRASLLAAKAARPTSGEWTEQVEARVIADDATGVRKLRIRDWQFIGDSGPAFGGWGLGPSSPELLCGVLATCLTHTYEIGAAWLEIPVDRIEIRVSALNNDAAFLDIPSDAPDLPWDITAHIALSAPEATTEQVALLHAYARERCPLTRLIRTANPVTLTVDA